MRAIKLHIGLFLPAVVFFCIECKAVELVRRAHSERSPDKSSVRWHSVKLTPKADRPLTRPRDKFNPVWWFKNSDQPEPPESYKPNDKRRALKWALRNPLHNFTFYVIGVADRAVVRSGLYPEDNFDPNGGWNVASTRYKWLRLPFVSWCRGPKGFHFYCGWRSSGNFGFKFNFE